MPQPEDRIPRTCRTCAEFERVVVRHQWENICWKTGKTAPMRICLNYINANK